MMLSIHNRLNGGTNCLDAQKFDDKEAGVPI